MKKYLIIGGSSGIGFETVNLLSAKQHQVIATYNRTLPDLNIVNTTYHQLDITNPECDLSFQPEVLDGLVYCPGSISLKPFGRIKPEEFAKDYELNVLGAIRCIQAALPALKKSELASVVLFSTVAVQTGLNFHSQVAASKGAIEGLTRALAAEFAPAIRFNCIAPGLTDTPLAAGLLNSEDKKNANAQRHPMKRVGTGLDIAYLTEFLLSNSSSWITGQVMHADGGFGTLK